MEVGVIVDEVAKCFTCAITMVINDSYEVSDVCRALHYI